MGPVRICHEQVHIAIWANMHVCKLTILARKGRVCWNAAKHQQDTQQQSLKIRKFCFHKSSEVDNSGCSLTHEYRALNWIIRIQMVFCCSFKDASRTYCFDPQFGTQQEFGHCSNSFAGDPFDSIVYRLNGSPSTAAPLKTIVLPSGE